MRCSAVLELDRPESLDFRSSVAESLAVLAGEQHTPAGLFLATAQAQNWAFSLLDPLTYRRAH